MTYDIKAYGAVGDGVQNDAKAIQAAIDACHEAGGGTVLVPVGNYLISTVELKSYVELHFETGAKFTSSLNRDDFGEDEYRCHVLGACHAKQVSITGFGIIDGRGRDANIVDDADGGLNECPLGFQGFRPRTTLFEDVEDITIRDITLYDAALWTLHLAGCRNVIVDGIKILNNDRGANNDGIDPDSCQNVIISNCHIFTGDDAIVLKTSKEMSPIYGPCENVTITGCTLHSRDSALKIGTETWGDVRNVVFANNVAYDCSRVVGIWMRDAHTVENIRISNIVGTTRRYADANRYPDHWWGKGESIFISNTYREPDKRPYTGTIKDIFIDNLSVRSESSLFIKSGGDTCPIENIRISNCDFTMVRQGTQATGLFDESPAFGGSKMTTGDDFFNAQEVYPHEIPAIYACGVNGLTVRDCDVRFINPEGEAWTEVAQIENCANVRLTGVVGKPAKEDLPAVKVENSTGVILNDVDACGAKLLNDDAKNVIVKKYI